MSLTLERGGRAAAPPRAQTKAAEGSSYGALVIAVAIGLSFGAYFVLRYFGFWSEQDTAVFARIISEMQREGGLRSPGAYTHGYAYPVWATTLANLTGVSVGELLQLYTPLIGNLFLGVFGFAAFRRLLASDRLGLFATSLLFLVPELFFTVSRGNHEKLTVSLTLLALLALLNSYQTRHQGGRWLVFAVWVGVLYIVAFMLVSLNILFGSSFLVASTFVLLFTAVTGALRPRNGAILRIVARRQVVVVSICWLLFVLVMWYIYPQTGTHSRLLDTTVERLNEMFLPTVSETAETEESFEVSDPYATGTTDWSSLAAYRTLSLFRWLLLIGSFGSWLVFFVRAWFNLKALTLPRLLLLSFYGAFALQLAMAVPIDFLNLSAGSNLQVRMYTYFALLAPPMFALGLGRLTQRISVRLFRSFWVAVVGITLVAFTCLTFLKATLDPAVSNRWLFYQPSEVQAVRFWDLHHENSFLWIGAEGRLIYAYAMLYPTGAEHANSFRTGEMTPRSTHALFSPFIRANAVAWQQAMPTYWLEDRPYDNGVTQIYHRTPRTPFQH